MVDTYQSVYRSICERLKPVTEAYLFEARELCCHFLKIDRACLHGLLGSLDSVPADGTFMEHLMRAVKKREEGYPLQYLLGEWEFYGRTFAVGEGVLIPRADTETVIEEVLHRVEGRRNLVIADLCSGSGCIAVTLAKELPDTLVYALEKSERAFSYLLRNIAANEAGVTAVAADVLAPPPEGLYADIIAANPPYLTPKDMYTLQREVSFEPEEALAGGEDGLYFYREITRNWVARLKPGGALVYEVGDCQGDVVAEILQSYRMTDICQRADLCGIIRVVSGAVNS